MSNIKELSTKENLLKPCERSYISTIIPAECLAREDLTSLLTTTRNSFYEKNDCNVCIVKDELNEKAPCSYCIIALDVKEFEDLNIPTFRR